MESHLRLGGPRRHLGGLKPTPKPKLTSLKNNCFLWKKNNNDKSKVLKD